MLAIQGSSFDSNWTGVLSIRSDRRLLVESNWTANAERADANTEINFIVDYKGGRNSAMHSAKVTENQLRKSISPKRRARSKNSFSNASKDEVTIHVCDEGRRTSKYFFCQKKMLVHVRRLSPL